MFFQKLSRLESFWQILMSRLFNDARAGETDHAFWLCQNDVSK